jgi:hypothetical protein
MKPPTKRLTREQVAELEIGHTDLSSTQARVLVVGFLLILAVIPIARQLAAFTDYGGVGWSILAEASGESLATARQGGLLQANRTLLQGMNRFESQLDERSHLQALLLPPTQALFTGFLNTGNEEVYTGLDGWLFYRPGIDHLIGPGFLEPKQLQARRQSGNEWETPPQPDPVVAILDFAAQLAERGIDLVVVPVPAKASIHPEKFTARYQADVAPIHNASYGQCMAELQDPKLFLDTRLDGYHGIMRNPANRAIYEAALKRLVTTCEGREADLVTVFDPSGLLASRARETGEPQFLSTDTHWTARAMELVAQRLAESIPGPLALPERRRAKTTLVAGSASQPGDLVAMLRLPPASTRYRSVPQSLQVVTSEDKPWRPDPEADILLLGDSFSNIYSDSSLKWGESAGFAEHLSQALDRPIDAIRQNGGGANAARAELANELRRANDRLAGKKLVIWQFAARELSAGDWRLLSMKVGKRTRRTQSLEGTTRQVSGIVKAMAPLPRPGHTPYKDHIVWVHLTDITGDAALAGGSALVYMRSMRDGKLTEVTRLRKGRRAQLSLRGWEDVKTQYGRIRREEPTDDDLILEEPLWGELGEAPADVTERASATPVAQPEATPTARQSGTPPALPPEELRQIRSSFGKLAASADGLMTVAGRNGWYFHSAELRQMALGQFWGKAALHIQPPRDARLADPLAAILAYHEECKRNGIELIVLPIPAKSVIYPEHLLDPTVCKTAEPRIDTAHQAFYDELRESGVDVLDLVPLFLAHRADAEGPVYCKQDTHYSPRACVLIAEEIAKQLKDRDWLTAMDRRDYGTRAETITITGDLCRELKTRRPPKEKLAIRRVGEGRDLTPIKPDDTSPVLLLSDSHGLVFHAGNEMHARGAGLPDQLAKELGFPVDLLAVMGSAARPARVSLFRRIRRDPGYLKRKKVIIWCFTVREFTNSSWGVIPLKK